MLIIVACLVLLTPLASTVPHHQPRVPMKKPHIVFMMVDDWGWADVGYHSETPTREVVTPNINSLVKQGLQIDHHYVFNWCSPSRSALLSGRLPIHVNDVATSETSYNPNDPVSGFDGIPCNMTGIATKMKEDGYMLLNSGWKVGCRYGHT